MKSLFSCSALPLGLVVCGIALAQTPPAAGSLSQQLERQQAPRPAGSAPPIRIEQGTTPATPASDAQKILIKHLHVAGSHVYPEAALLALTGFRPPRELTLAELRAMGAKIADYYHAHGYFLAQAYLPAQDIKDGVVTIAVLEGHYGKVVLHNQSGLSDGLATDLLSGLHSGDTVAIGPLESRMLLLADVPGVNVKSTLVPGASVGASDLIVDVSPGQRVSGSIDASNQGNRYTGSALVGAALNVNDLSGHGDVASVRLLTSGAGLHYGRAAWQAQIGRARAGLAYSSMDYRLGQDFASLQAHGTATIVSLYGSYPLIRSRSNNLSLQVDLDAKTFQDRADASATRTDKNARVAMTSLTGDFRDGLGGGGLSSYAVTWSSGSIDIRSPAALATDAATVRSNGHYDKLSFNLARLQHVTGTTSLFAALNGQFAAKNLDVSEKIGLGGATGVRAYPTGEAYGDQGYVLNLEARTLLPAFPQRLPGQLQLIGFVDTGTVTLNKTAWAAGQNHRTLSGAGVGLNWTGDSNFVVKAYLAHKLGNAVATSAPDAQTRFWLQAVKYF